MAIDIYVREKSGSREIQFPLLPEEFEFSAGDTVFVTHDIIGRGEAATPSGTELGIYSWMSEFPGAQRKTDAMLRGTWKEPSAYDSILRDWKAKGTKLTLLITGYPVNVDVYIREYKSRGSGAFGDIVYEITFVEARDITIKTSKVEATTTRPATSSSTYVIKSGDTLWGISQKFYGNGTKWKTIYDANKEIIEQTAKKYGKSSSDNGHWIYPGVKLTIPGVDSTGAATNTSSTTTTAGAVDTTTQSTTEVQKTESYLTQRQEGVKELVNRAKSVLDRKLTM